MEANPSSVAPVGSRPIGLSEALAAGAPLSWTETVAVVRDVAMHIHWSATPLNVPTLSQISILPNGFVQIEGGRPTPGGPGRRSGRSDGAAPRLHRLPAAAPRHPAPGAREPARVRLAASAPCGFRGILPARVRRTNLRRTTAAPRSRSIRPPRIASSTRSRRRRKPPRRRKKSPRRSVRG